MIQYTEREVLEILADGTYSSANELLNENIPTLEKRMTKAVQNLALLLSEVKKSFPDAILYTNSGGLVLMLGNSHNKNEKPQRQLIAANWSNLISIGDGAF